MNAQRNLSSRLRFRPRLEDLEGRLVPTVTVTPGGGSLSLVATTKQAHSIQIMDDGKGDVSVTADGMSSSFTGISSVSIKGGNKADSVFYMLTGPVTQGVSVTADLKGGTNSFVALVPQDIKAGGSVGFTVKNSSGTGKDSVAVNVLGAVESGGSLAVIVNPSNGSGASESVNLLGGKKIAGFVMIDLEGTNKNDTESVMIGDDIDTTGLVMVIERGKPGNDTETISYSGQDKGTLLTQADGGPDKDTISTQILLSTGSSGAVIAGEAGGPGNDQLTLAVRKQTGDNPSVTASVDGGTGTADKAMVTPGVTTTAVENVVMIM